MPQRRVQIAFTMTCIVLFPLSLWADTLHVPADYSTIQRAIDAAVNNDEIVVAPGHYNETINLRGKAVTLRSTDPSDDATVRATVLDGTGLDSSVIACIAGEGLDTLIDGLTITNGVGRSLGGDDFGGGGMRIRDAHPTLRRCVFASNGHATPPVLGTVKGGAILIERGSPEITSCHFEYNVVRDGRYTHGGAVYLAGGNPVFQDCAFLHNSADRGSRGGAVYVASGTAMFSGTVFEANSAWLGEPADGGAVYLESGDATFTRCEFYDNETLGNCQSYGGALAGHHYVVEDCVFAGNSTQSGSCAGGDRSRGGAIYGNGTILESLFVGNRAGGSGSAAGGAVYGDALVVRSAFENNRASSAEFMGGGAITGNVRVYNSLFSRNSSYDGGAVSGSGDFVNCVFEGNTAASGGAAKLGGSWSLLINCTIVDNESNDAAVVSSGGLLVANSIAWGNDPAQLDVGSITVRYSCVQGGYSGLGNTDKDPRFVDLSTGDYRLAAHSPCIDAGDNTSVPRDDADLDSDGDTSEAIPLDLDFLPRFVDDLGTSDTGIGGNGHQEVVDMGAYERDFVSTGPIRWYVNRHHYERFDIQMDWEAASAFAETLSVDGVSGHLATITRQLEQDFIVANLGQELVRRCWLGAEQPDPNVPADQGWAWVTGEAWGYTNWCAGEPNDYNGGEDALQFSNNGTQPVGGWNDASRSIVQSGFIVEYPAACPPDLNDDGSVDSRDFVLFLNAFTAGDPVADFDANGRVNSQDFVMFLNAFAAGC
jgi:hypothetical protein